MIVIKNVHLIIMNKKIINQLKKQAKKASSFAYSPFSKVKVGCAVLTQNNKIFSGCNVENISFGGTICAERTAILKAVSEGFQEFSVLYLYTKEQWAPCGMCLQVISEFFKPDALIILGSDNKEDIYQLKDLLPRTTDLKTFKKLQN